MRSRSTCTDPSQLINILFLCTVIVQEKFHATTQPSFPPALPPVWWAHTDMAAPFLDVVLTRLGHCS